MTFISTLSCFHDFPWFSWFFSLFCKAKINDALSFWNIKMPEKSETQWITRRNMKFKILKDLHHSDISVKSYGLWHSSISFKVFMILHDFHDFSHFFANLKKHFLTEMTNFWKTYFYKKKLRSFWQSRGFNVYDF